MQTCEWSGFYAFSISIPPTDITKTSHFQQPQPFSTHGRNPCREITRVPGHQNHSKRGSKHGEVGTPPWEVQKYQAVKLMSMIRNKRHVHRQALQTRQILKFSPTVILGLVSEICHFRACATKKIFVKVDGGLTRPLDKAWVLNFEFSLLRCHPATLQLSPQNPSCKGASSPKTASMPGILNEDIDTGDIDIIWNDRLMISAQPKCHRRCMQEICRTCAVCVKLNINMICQLLLSTSAHCKKDRLIFDNHG